MISRAHRRNTRAIVLVATTVAVATVGCNSRERRSVAESAVATAPSSGASPGGVPVGDWHLPAPGVPCPSTGGWGACTVLERLDRAGLAPRVTPDMVGEAPLQQSGRLIRLGSAELKVFVYPDSVARQRDEARLDRHRYIEATQEPTLRNEATIIRSANLLAILDSKSGTQRERVSLAITAGPPQPKP
jgi:hypothetical protein